MPSTGASVRRPSGIEPRHRRARTTTTPSQTAAVSTSRSGRTAASISAGSLPVTANAFGGQETPHVVQGEGSGKCSTTRTDGRYSSPATASTARNNARSRGAVSRPDGKASRRYTSAGSTNHTAVRPMLYTTLSLDTASAVTDSSNAVASSFRANRSPGRRCSAQAAMTQGTPTISPNASPASRRSSGAEAASVKATVAAVSAAPANATADGRRPPTRAARNVAAVTVMPLRPVQSVIVILRPHAPASRWCAHPENRGGQDPLERGVTPVAARRTRLGGWDRRRRGHLRPPTQEPSS